APSAALRELNAQLAARRRQRSHGMIHALVRDGELRRPALRRSDVLHEQGEMISSHWLSASALRDDLADDRAAALHYAKLGMALLEPWCTAAGLRSMRRVLAGDHDAEAWPVR